METGRHLRGRIAAVKPADNPRDTKDYLHMTDSASPTMSKGDSLEGLSEDIMSVTGMPFPNLVWRLLGEDPHRLRSCWGRVREGLNAVGVETLGARILEPTLNAASPLEDACPLDTEKVETLLSVFDAYDAGNACNAVAVRLLLDGSPGNPGSDLLLPTGRSRRASVRATLPPMFSLTSMTPTARDQVLKLADVLNPTTDVVPSAFRHLAQDPDLLRSLAATLDRANSEGFLQEVSKAAQDAVAATASAWPAEVEPVSDPSAQALLEPFADGIPRMLAVSALLRVTYS